MFKTGASALWVASSLSSCRCNTPSHGRRQSSNTYIAWRHQACMGSKTQGLTLGLSLLGFARARQRRLRAAAAGHDPEHAPERFSALQAGAASRFRCRSAALHLAHKCSHLHHLIAGEPQLRVRRGHELARCKHNSIIERRELSCSSARTLSRGVCAVSGPGKASSAAKSSLGLAPW